MQKVQAFVVSIWLEWKHTNQDTHLYLFKTVEKNQQSYYFISIFSLYLPFMYYYFNANVYSFEAGYIRNLMLSIAFCFGFNLIIKNLSVYIVLEVCSVKLIVLVRFSKTINTQK